MNNFELFFNDFLICEKNKDFKIEITWQNWIQKIKYKKKI
jgi:hypothetical protein